MACRWGLGLTANDLGAGAACRPLVVGEVSGKESEIDYSVDPRTGKDFRGTEIENGRAHLDLRWEFDNLEFRSITAYTENKLNSQEDFDLTDYALVPLTPGQDLLTFAGLSNQVGFSAASISPMRLNSSARNSAFSDTTKVSTGLSVRCSGRKT